MSTERYSGTLQFVTTGKSNTERYSGTLQFVTTGKSNTQFICTARLLGVERTTVLSPAIIFTHVSVRPNYLVS
jgi:hypothetical protein